MIKKILIFVFFVNLFLTSYSSADDKIGVTHELGFQITGYYTYDEPHLMYNRSKLIDQIKDESKSLENFGFVYNFKKNTLFNEYLSEFEFDADYRHIKYDYWSDSTGTDTNKDNHIFNLRTMYGFQLTDKLMLKSGLGYRSLKDPGGGTTSSTGNWAYDRIQEYRYVPILAEIKMPISSIDGKLKLEYDHVFYGYNASLLSVGGGANRDKNFRNDDGYMVKAAYKIPYKSFYLEPYYEFHSIEESTVESGSVEPSNTTDEYGIKVTQKFGENKLTSIPKAKRKNINDNYYFGFGLMQTEVESGFSSLTGTAKQEEQNLGKKLFAGISLNDNLDLEFALNKFGETILTCNNTDTIVTDGRYNKAADPNGTTLTCSADNVSVNIISNSLVAAIKPKSPEVIIKDHSLNMYLLFGLNAWDQSETTLTVGTSTSASDYSGASKMYGMGGTIQKNNLNFSFEYQDFDMYYHAKSFGASLSYKF